MGMTQRILAAAILVLGSTASAGERPTAEQLLKACQKSFESLARARIECQDVMKQADERVSKLTRELTIVRNAERWKIDYLGGGTYAGGKDFVWWGQTLVGEDIIRASLPKGPPQDPQQRPSVIAYRDDHARRVWDMLSPAQVVFGHIEGDAGYPLWAVMGEASNLELLPDPEEIGGDETWVLKSRGKFGEHTVWFDPQKGGLPRRIEIRKQNGDLYNDEQLGSRPADSPPRRGKPGQPAPFEARQDIFDRIDNIQVEEKDGVFVITGFDCAHRFTRVRTRKPVETRSEFRIRAIEIDPKLTEGALEFDIKIPNSTRVGVFLNAPLEFSSGSPDTYEEWNDGKLQKPPGQ